MLALNSQYVIIYTCSANDGGKKMLEKICIYGALFVLPLLWLGTMVVITFNIIN